MIKNIPAWICNIISDFKCPTCKKSMNSSGINAIGIRESHKDKSQCVLYVIYSCKTCKDNTNIELQECDINQFAYLMSDSQMDVSGFGQQDNDDIKDIKDGEDQKEVTKVNKSKLPIKEKSKISVQEINEFKKRLASLSGDELSRALGVPVIESKEFDK